MIRKLRLRMTLMVIAVLILVSAGIVLAIHLSNERNIAAQAEDTLAVLAAKRARQLLGGAEPKVAVSSTKNVTRALAEVAEGKIGYERTSLSIK